MDLDIPAWSSYALIIVVSAFAAAGQVDKLLIKVPLRWTYAESYLLFVGLFVLPLLLFWALDRVGAVHDCSLVSAMIVAFGYPAIISGNSKQSNSTATAIFSPVLKWLNGIPQKLGARLQSSQMEFETSVANAVGRDDALLPVLETWLLKHTDDLVAVQEKLEELDQQPETAPPVGLAAGSLEMRAWSQGRAQRLAMLVDGKLAVRIRFWRMGLTSARVAWREVVRLDQTFRFGLPLVLVATLTMLAVVWFRGASEDAQQSVVGDLTVNNIVPRYHAWRYLKANNTQADIRRALSNLAVGLQLEIPVCRHVTTDKLESDVQATSPLKANEDCGNVEAGEAIDLQKAEEKKQRLERVRARATYSKEVTSVLQEKEITIALADDLLKMVFAGRLERTDPSTACAAIMLLPPALRSPNVEIRNLLKRSLVEASEALWGPFPPRDPLPNLDVGPNADTVGIEVVVENWSALMDAHCIVPPPQKSVSTEPQSPQVPDKPIVLSDVNFEFDSAELREAATAALNVVVAQFRAQEHLKAEIRGYTDSIGSPGYNRKLSKNRALSVKLYLVTHGVAEAPLSTRGYGAGNPVATNDTPVGRAKNRRVEIQFQQRERAEHNEIT